MVFGGKKNCEGSTIDGIAPQYGLEQFINEPTHSLKESSSCIDLIFTSQPNLEVELEVRSSL